MEGDMNKMMHKEGDHFQYLLKSPSCRKVKGVDVQKQDCTQQSITKAGFFSCDTVDSRSPPLNSF